MERGVEGRNTAPPIGYESLTDVRLFGRVMGRVTPADIRRLAATNSTDVYLANEVAIEAATIYSEEALRADDETERNRLIGYATRSLTIATMLSEHTHVVDRTLGTPLAHLVALSADWRERDPIAHQTVLSSMAAQVSPVVQPKHEAPRNVGNIKKSARKLSVPVALATASAILVAHPAAAAAAEDKPIRDEVAKGPANSKQEVAANVQKMPADLDLDQVVASGIPLEDSTSKHDGDARPDSKKEPQVSSVETLAPVVKNPNKVDDAKPPVEQTMPSKPTRAPASTKGVVDTKNNDVTIRTSERVDEQKVIAPPLAAAPVDLDALIDSNDTGKPEGADAKNVSAGDPGYKTETIGHSKTNVSEIVPTAPVATQVDLDTLQPEDAKAIAAGEAVPTVAKVTDALINIDTLFDKHEAIDEAVIATEPAAQRPVELPKPEVPKPAPQEVAPAAPVVSQEQSPYQLNAEQNSLIDTLNLSADKKAFLKQVTAGAIGLHLRGSKVNPEVVVAQSILESGWGGSGLAKQANNYFGMKASSDWKGKTISMPTQEFINGSWVMVDAEWRAFDDAEDCFAEYAKFIEQRPHFADALEHTGNPEEYVKALVNGGLKYATDPDYVQKIMGTVRANHITEIVKIADQAEAKRIAKTAADEKAAADAKEAARLAVAKQEQEAGNPKWHLPVPEGSRQSPQYPGHKGIDYAVNTGTPFFASIGGTVKVLTYDVSDAGFCKAAMANIGTDMSAVKDPIQREVRITTKIGDDTYEVIYAHMSQIDVKDGQVVEGGQQIGLTGGSGCSTGPHAHFEIRKNGKAISPTEVLNGVDVRTLSGSVVVVAKGAADPAEYEGHDAHGHLDIHGDESQASETVYVDIKKLQSEDGQSELTDDQRKWWDAQRQLADWKRQAEYANK